MVVNKISIDPSGLTKVNLCFSIIKKKFVISYFDFLLNKVITR